MVTYIRGQPDMRRGGEEQGRLRLLLCQQQVCPLQERCPGVPVQLLPRL
jgi:hypothetical protein